MLYRLTCRPGESHLRIDIEGLWPDQDLQDFMDQIRALWEENQRRPLLLDITKLVDSPSVFADFESAKLLADTGFYEIGRIAVLDLVSRRQANEFFETTAFNRGLQFRFFYSEEQGALDWLLSEGRGCHG